MAVDKTMWTERARTLAFGLAVMAALFGLLLVAKPAHAATFTVNSAGDGVDADLTDGVCETATANECTLRAAIQEANNTADADTIDFNITGTGCDATSGVCTINVGSSATASGEPLPDIIQPVTINGYSQPGADENDILVARDGTNANLLIELNGTNVTAPASPHNGLAINASNVMVKGLVINRFSGTGIFIFFDGSGAAIEGNFIGTDPSGTSDLGNGTGVTAFGGGANIIGGREAAAHNLISGNSRGLTIASNTGNTIQGNLIGTDKDGTDGTNTLGNSAEGVGIGSSNNIVGSAAADNDLDSNLIAFNGDDGILISGGTGNRILNNRIHSNLGLGIDLVGGREDINGVTKNDKKDRDKDPNNLQNFPVLSSAETKGTTTTIKGTLKSRPRKTFIIQLFSSPEKDPSGFGEGKEFMGQVTKKTNREGKFSFSFTTGDIRGTFVTATATNNLTGDTSEFSAAKKVT